MTPATNEPSGGEREEVPPPPQSKEAADAPRYPDYGPAAAGAMDAIALLQRKGELELKRRTAGQPLAARRLMALAETHRCQGNFEAAIEIYEQVASAQRGDWRKAAWLHAMLRQGQLPFVPPSGVWPAPFVYIENLLPRTEHERVLAIALALAPRFQQARLGSGEYRHVDESRRRGLAIDQVGCEELRSLLVPRLRPLLVGIQERLRLSPNAPYRFSHIDLAAYPHGNFGGAHRDASPRPYPRLSLNAVYFFHRQPLTFTGGDLLLYDTDVETGISSRLAFSRIAPTSNSLVLLPASYWHAVTQVASRSSALRDARLSACFSVFDEEPEESDGG